MCTFCKRIREDSGQWLTFEVYLRRRTDAQVSHGLCPACEAQHDEP